MEWRLYVRNPGAMFWTFAFPMLLLMGFGTIFRSGSAPALTLVVAGVDRPAPTPAGAGARPRPSWSRPPAAASPSR
jgi:hypothetical protein